MIKGPDIIGKIMSLKRARPFLPFVIRLKDGRRFEMDDPIGFAVAGTSVHCPSAHDGMMRIDAQEIDSAEVIVPDPVEKRMLETILALKHREPFVGFEIVMNSGDRYLIENPDLLAVGKSELAYYFPRSNKVAFLRTSQITAVQQLEERPAA